MRLANLTWPKAQEYFEKNDMVLISIGSIECHGRHMPLGTDTLIPDFLLEKIEQKSDVLIAPTIPYGACQSLAPYPGTIDIDNEVLYQFCRQIFLSLYRHGARKFVFLNGHGGNMKMIERLGLEFEDKGCLVAMLNWWLMAWDMNPAWKGGHGGGEETAAILGIDPSLVDKSEIGGELQFKHLTENLKTHSGAKKRFNLTKTGKVKRAHAFKSHILTKKPTKRTRNLRKNGYADVTVEDAVATANALLAGGVDVMEITFRTAAAADSIKAVAESCPDMLVGAGTVITLEQCKQAVGCGAKFIVSPGFDEEVVRWCVENGIAVTPGCVTPSEIMAAMKLGLTVVKFFPAGVYGGLSAMKALSGPFGGIKFIPTGGVNSHNIGEFIAAPFIHAVGSSWVCPKADIAAGNFEKITTLCKQARAAIQEVRK